MKKCFVLFLLSLLFQAVYSQNPDTYPGLWLGVLKVSEQMSLQLAFEIEGDSSGNYLAKMNVIEQNAFDIPMDACEIIHDTMRISFKAAGIAYTGVYFLEKDSIRGTYEQGGGRFSLDLGRVEHLPLEVERPQTPVRPFPYEEEEVFFENVEAGIKLAGTLTMPTGGMDLPAVVLIAGSGRNDRDETSMGHFLLLSDFLTRNGYAVLRYDKRGVGDSGGDFGAASTFDFADDARAAMEFLKSRHETVPHLTGLIGHSEGALIAAIIAAEHQDELGFVVMMGGIGIPGSELLLLQSAKMAAISGMSDEQTKEITEINTTLYTIAQSDESDSVISRKLLEAAPGIASNQLQMLQWPWFRTFLALDPHTYLSRVTCPALAITGEKDIQCPPDENLSAIEQSLQEAGNQNFEIVEMAGLNHLFQTAGSGSPLEYEQIGEIISPDALKAILDWMNRTINRDSYKLRTHDADNK